MLTPSILSDTVRKYLSTPESIWYALFTVMNVLFLFDLYVDWRQHTVISNPKRPKELSKLCTEEEYAKSREYNVDRSRVSLYEKVYNHILGLATLFIAVPWIWKFTGNYMTNRLGFTSDSEITHSALHQVVVTIISALQPLPVSIYRTFWLERKHGFNKTTVRTFVMDLIKGVLLGLILGIPFTLVFLWVIKRTGNYFVVATCAVTLVIQMLMVLIYPTLIAPLFNKFTLLEEGELKSKISALANRINFPLTKIFVIDGSTRSTHSNAYFFGFYKNKRIVLFDTLIEQMSSEEVAAIVGHELGHWAHNHMLHGLIQTQLNILWMFSLFGLVMNYEPLYAALGLSDRPLVIGILLFSQLISPLGMIANLFMTWHSRCREFQADRYAIDLGYGNVLPTAIIKLYKENKTILPHPNA
ncbi:hypothetical protein PSACC_00414 [Paramicrosporidium saccamoebae]|uniref:CAAX prenyl protease n=1 Tax=Paramicrosporidium saccamoebae TaxID=1246581 RepID=A0A2H9TPV4_9FUNG|nr:hypothetical protein PSACC_00414 [Paramicrosporidium saccamoebae]